MRLAALLMVGAARRAAPYSTARGLAVDLRPPAMLGRMTTHAVALLAVGLVGCQHTNVRYIDVARKPVWDAEISPDGRSIVALVGGQVRCFEIPSLDEKWSRRLLQSDLHQVVRFDSTGSNVLVVVLDYADWENSTQALLKLSAEDGTDVSRMPLPQMPRIVDIEGDSNICVVGGRSEKFVGKIVDGQIQLLSSGHERAILSGSDAIVAVEDRDHVFVIDYSNGRQLYSCPRDGCSVIGFSNGSVLMSDGHSRTVVASPDGGIKEYPVGFESATGKRPGHLVGLREGEVISYNAVFGEVRRLAGFRSSHAFLTTDDEANLVLVAGGSLGPFVTHDGFLFLVVP